MRASGWGWRHAGRAGWAVRGLDLVIEPGERVLLLGASGAGKSTLVQALAGVLGGADEGEEEGELLIGGLHPEASRGQVGLVLQDPDSQIVLARVGDDVAFGCENLGVPRDEIWPRVDRALAAVGLDLSRDHPTNHLSGGQKQRLALAGVLAMRPELLLLDEPTANLDPAGVLEVRDAVARVVHASTSTFVVIEHRVDIWLDVVDRLVVLAPGGGVLADGDPATVLRERGDDLARDGIWVPGRDPLGGSLARRARADRSAIVADAASQEVLTHRESADAAPPRTATAPATPSEVSAASVAASGAATPRAAEPAEAEAADAASRALLDVHRLTVARTPGVPVASGIEIELRAGECLAVTGPNGAGKTTFALTAAGLLPAAGGTVVAAGALLEAGDGAPTRRRGLRRLLRRSGRDAATSAAVQARDSVDTDPYAWSSRALLTRIGTVFQDPEHQFVSGTVRRELEVSLRALKLPEQEIASRVDEVAGRLRLGGLLDANPYTLSGGEKRRLSVASALVARPRVLVLDEPTFGQDSRTWAELVRLLAEQLDRGTAVVAVTHDRAFIDALADRELVIGGAATPNTARDTDAARDAAESTR